MPSFPLLTVIVACSPGGEPSGSRQRPDPRLCRWISLSVTLIELSLISSIFFLNLQPGSGPTGAWLLVEDYPWLETLGARFSLGLDGVSLMLLLLTAFPSRRVV